jgi:uncharacterized protein (DUF2141 family)
MKGDYMKRILLFGVLLFLTSSIVSCGTEEEDLTPGSISGTLTVEPGAIGDLDGARVAIYLSLANWQSDNTFQSVLATGSGGTASYTMSDVPPGTYLLDAWKDVNANLQFDAGDFFGVYDTVQSPNSTPIEFFLSAGEALTIDVTMFELP